MMSSSREPSRRAAATSFESISRLPAEPRCWIQDNRAVDAHLPVRTSAARRSSSSPDARAAGRGRSRKSQRLYAKACRRRIDRGLVGGAIAAHSGRQSEEHPPVFNRTDQRGRGYQPRCPGSPGRAVIRHRRARLELRCVARMQSGGSAARLLATLAHPGSDGARARDRHAALSATALAKFQSELGERAMPVAKDRPAVAGKNGRRGSRRGGGSEPWPPGIGQLRGCSVVREPARWRARGLRDERRLRDQESELARCLAS